MRPVVRVAFLTSLWVLLWGRLSVANVASGVALSVLLLVAFPVASAPTGPIGRPRPLAMLHLFAFILRQIVVSNAYITREIVTPGSRIRTGIVVCPLRTDSERLVTFIANVLALSPGTMPVEVEMSPPCLHIHVLHLYDPDRIRTSITRLETLAMKAFGSS